MFDLDKWIKEHNVPIVGEPIEEKGIRKYYLPCCPFDSNHTGKDAILIKDINTGRISFKCFHDSCKDKHWKNFRMLYEAEAYDQNKAASKEDPEELPPIKCWSDICQNVPSRSPELISGILRKGHKLLISGASKAGKSFLIMELAIAITEGRKWLGFQCQQGKVLYINLEIDEASFENRLKDIYAKLGWTTHHQDALHFWTLRGLAKPLNELTPLIIERIKDQDYAAVIIDPIYKVIMGDENNASDMGKFCNQFDKICREAGCAAIYCHHHSKGGQGNKKSIDRASGSGVFGRDSDAILDMIELELNEEASFGKPEGATAWRLESSLREFKCIKPINFWFEYPLHIIDDSGILAKLNARGSSLSNLEKSGKRKSNREENANKVAKAIDQLIDKNDRGYTTIKEIQDHMEESISDTTIRNYIKDFLYEDYEYRNKTIYPKKNYKFVDIELPADEEWKQNS